MVCVLDFKKEVGFWHSVLAAIFAGMRVVFVPYSIMKINPAVWMTYLSKNQTSSVVLLKSR
jgi:acyl-coenzyme A synthetase/AMP-(fatty) acid ligase